MIDQAERLLQGRLYEIKRDRPDFSGVVFDQVSQAVFSYSTTIKQFFLDTPTRAEATALGAWNDIQDCADDSINDAARMVDDPLPPLFPGLQSPQHFDLQTTNQTCTEQVRASNGERAGNVDQAMINQATAVLSRDGIDARRHESVSSRYHASLFSDATSANGVSSPSAMSSASGASSANDMLSPSDTPSCENYPSTASTPASTPPPAYRASFEPVHSRGETLQATLDRPETTTGPVANTVTLDCYGSNAVPAAQQKHFGTSVEDVRELNESPETGDIRANQSYTSWRTQFIIDEVHDAVATRTNACNVHPCEMDESSNDQPRTDCDEADSASTAQYISGRETNLPRAASVEMDMQTASESVSRKRKASTGEMQRNDKIVKILGPKPFHSLQLQNVPGHVKQPANFLDEVHIDNDINLSLATLIQRLFYGIGHPKTGFILKYKRSRRSKAGEA